MIAPSNTPVCWRVDMVAPTIHSSVFEDILEGHCAVVSSFLIPPDDRSRLQGISEISLDENFLYTQIVETALIIGAEISNFIVTPMENRDWVAENLELFPPIRVGRYFIYGSHFDGAKPSGSIGIKLDAGPAFGTGEHATTETCLSVFERLTKRGKHFNRILDMGCGSGILSLAAAKTWRSKVIACDIDPGAVQVAIDNTRINRVESFIRCRAGNGFKAPIVQAGSPYDLIVSNIFANPLCLMALDLTKHLQPKGTVILSGFITADARRVIANYTQFRLVLCAQIIVDDWVTLIFRKPTS